MNFLGLIPSVVKDRIRRRAGAVTMKDRLRNLRSAGFSPRKIVDGGAFRGDWAHLARSIFPEAELLLIEPQPHLASRLAATCGRLRPARHRACLLGPAPGTASFLLDESNSRIVESRRAGPVDKVVDVPMETLERVAEQEGFSDCEFLKLDLQGHELDALAGAGPLWGSIEVMLLEVSWLPIGNPPLTADVIAAMSAHGYHLYDVMGFNYRPLDAALWQTDLLFVRLDSPLLARRHEWQ